jgi:hypothetical protein
MPFGRGAHPLEHLQSVSRGDCWSEVVCTGHAMQLVAAVGVFAYLSAAQGLHTDSLVAVTCAESHRNQISNTPSVHCSASSDFASVVSIMSASAAAATSGLAHHRRRELSRQTGRAGVASDCILVVPSISCTLNERIADFFMCS